MQSFKSWPFFGWKSKKMAVLDDNDGHMQCVCCKMETEPVAVHMGILHLRAMRNLTLVLLG